MLCRRFQVLSSISADISLANETGVYLYISILFITLNKSKE